MIELQHLNRDGLKSSSCFTAETKACRGQMTCLSSSYFGTEMAPKITFPDFQFKLCPVPIYICNKYKQCYNLKSTCLNVILHAMRHENSQGKGIDLSHVPRD